MQSKISKLAGELYKEGRISFAEAVTLIVVIDNANITDKDIQSAGTQLIDGLSLLKGEEN